MQITLNQGELIAAIHQYISKQGINLTHKHLDVTFTPGRKAGLTAEVDIKESDELPVFTNYDEDRYAGYPSDIEEDNPDYDQAEELQYSQAPTANEPNSSDAASIFG